MVNRHVRRRLLALTLPAFIEEMNAILRASAELPVAVERDLRAASDKTHASRVELIVGAGLTSEAVSELLQIEHQSALLIVELILARMAKRDQSPVPKELEELLKKCLALAHPLLSEGSRALAQKLLGMVADEA